MVRRSAMLRGISRGVKVMSAWTKDLGQRVWLVLNALKGLGNVFNGSHGLVRSLIVSLPSGSGIGPR